MAEKSVAQKLQVRPGQSVAIVNGPVDAMEKLGQLPGGLSVSDDPAAADMVLLFVRDSAELSREWPRLRDGRRQDSALWIAYPKKSGAIRTDISRDHGWEPLVDDGLDAVSLVSIDDTWAAIRFRHAPRLRAERAARGAVAPGHRPPS